MHDAQSLASSTFDVRLRLRPTDKYVHSFTVTAYSPQDAQSRALDRWGPDPLYPQKAILSLTQISDPQPVTCTYEGVEGATGPKGPWVFMDSVDRWAPVLRCDVHGCPAWGIVYETATADRPGGLERYNGPCTHHPEPLPQMEGTPSHA